MRGTHRPPALRGRARDRVARARGGPGAGCGVGMRGRRTHVRRPPGGDDSS